MKRWRLWVIGAVVLLAAGWAGYRTLSIYALSRALTDCQSDVVQEAISPDGYRVATAFERGCGATSPFTRVVGVRPKGTRFDGESKSEWVFFVEGQPDIRLTWTGPDRLTVKHSGSGGRVIRQAVVWDGLAVSYE